MSQWDVQYEKYRCMHDKARLGELSWDLVMNQTWILMNYVQTDLNQAFVLEQQKTIMAYLTKLNTFDGLTK